MEKYFVKAEWDDEASVWYVAETNVPGLRTEATTADDLIRKLEVMIPEMLSLNCAMDYASVPFELIAHKAASTKHCH